MSDVETMRRPRRWHILVFMAPAIAVYTTIMIIPLADTLRLGLYRAVDGSGVVRNCLARGHGVRQAGDLLRYPRLSNNSGGSVCSDGPPEERH